MTRIRKVEPNHTYALCKRAHIRILEGNFENAPRCLGMVKTIDPNNKYFLELMTLYEKKASQRKEEPS